MNEDILNVSGLKVKIGKKTILDDIDVGFSKGECVLIDKIIKAFIGGQYAEKRME